jgi:hypothetical protein
MAQNRHSPHASLPARSKKDFRYSLIRYSKISVLPNNEGTNNI